MCVIAYSTGTKLDDNTTRQMWQANQDGAGLAWAEDGRVHWEKGLMHYKAFASAYKRIKPGTPHVMHFRIATVGGAQPTLTHPFVVDAAKESPLDLTGSLDAGMLLCHNGHWSDWRDVLIKSTLGGGFLMPSGAMSDSRAMAVLAARHGANFLSSVMSGQRVVTLATDGGMLVYGTGWATGPKGLTYSNLHWLRGQSCNPTHVMSTARTESLVTRASDAEVRALERQLDLVDNARVAVDSDGYEYASLEDEMAIAAANAKPEKRTKSPVYLDRTAAEVQAALRYEGKRGWVARAGGGGKKH